MFPSSLIMEPARTRVLRNPSRRTPDFVCFPFGARSLAGRDIYVMRWVFGDCILDEERRELRRGGASAAVEPQVFDLLIYLIRNRERVISKEDLLKAVWHGRIVSDFGIREPN